MQMKLLMNSLSHLVQDIRGFYFILITSIRESDFIFDLVQLMYYQCHEINFKRGGSYIDSPAWTKKKKTIINPKNTFDKCFQYTATVTLNYGEIKWDPEEEFQILNRL